MNKSRYEELQRKELKQILAERQVQQQELAEYLKVTPGAFSRRMKQGQLPPSYVKEILDYLGIDEMDFHVRVMKLEVKVTNTKEAEMQQQIDELKNKVEALSAENKKHIEEKEYYLKENNALLRSALEKPTAGSKNIKSPRKKKTRQTMLRLRGERAPSA